MKQKKVQNGRLKKFKMAASKKPRFPAPPILNIFAWNFYGLVFGLVELIDAKRVGLAQLIWSWGCPTQAQKQPKNTKNAFFACFWAYVRQPHDHISWAIPMPFVSINSTNPRTNPWKCHEKILRIGGAGKRGFFEAAILNFLSRPFWTFFCFISVKNPGLSYEVSFFSALWMVFPESWKRICPNFYAHDCILDIFNLLHDGTLCLTKLASHCFIIVSFLSTLFDSFIWSKLELCIILFCWIVEPSNENVDRQFQGAKEHLKTVITRMTIVLLHFCWLITTC